MWQLGNDTLAIGVQARGAELTSLRHRPRGREWLWQGDARFWGRRAPLLFPVVGRVKEDRYTWDGVSYPMSKHGFARDRDFALSYASADTLTLRLTEDAETRRMYPAAFVLEVSYRLQGNSLGVTMQVENPGDEPLWFNLGGHPAFNCPMEEEAWRIEAPGLASTARLLHPATGLLTDREVALPWQEENLPLGASLFAADALLFPQVPMRQVALVRVADRARLDFTFADFPVFALWSAGPFVCLEPWLALPDREDAPLELEAKPGFCCLPPGQSYRAGYQLRIS